MTDTNCINLEGKLRENTATIKETKTIQENYSSTKEVLEETKTPRA